MIKLKILLENNRRYKLFCDMDGVLTDFESSVKKICGISPNKYENKYGTDELWAMIENEGESFWSEMPWMPDGKKLWSYIKYKEPIILSTPSRSKLSKTGKIKWVRQNLGNFEVILEENKQKYATNNYILIDDLYDNIDKWNANNGIGILHKSAIDTIKKLKEIKV